MPYDNRLIIKREFEKDGNHLVNKLNDQVICRITGDSIVGLVCIAADIWIISGNIKLDNSKSSG